MLLNNDVIVTDGWLDQLISLANARPGAGHGSPAHDAGVIAPMPPIMRPHGIFSAESP